jgi:DinB family protein/pentapeptide repeat protein
MADFDHADLRGSRFTEVNLQDSTFREVYFKDVTMRGCLLCDVSIDGELRNVVINGVDVAPLVEAELDRRDPDRVRMRPTEPEGYREAWDVVERHWADTVERARGFSADELHASVDGEWSFIETLRHLAFATDAWVRRGILGDPTPWDPLDLPWDGMDDTPGVPRDRAVRPSLDEVLRLRHDRMSTVRHVVDGLTTESLAAHTPPVDAPGWPPAGESFPVSECLLTVFNEEGTTGSSPSATSTLSRPSAASAHSSPSAAARTRSRTCSSSARSRHVGPRTRSMTASRW